MAAAGSQPQAGPTGAGESDLLLWRQASTGATYLWTMSGSTVSSSVNLGTSPDWSVIATGDFNGDGNTDLLWRQAVTGATVMWLMNGSTISSATYLGGSTDWAVTATGDFNGDGKTDLIWRQASTGATYMWLMNGASTSSSALLGTSTDWSVTATGDFNGDGKADLIWRQASTGATVMWLMNGASTLSSTLLGTPSTDWSVVATGDFNGDGKTDLIWRQASTGATYMWLMNGSTVLSSVNLGTSPDWSVVATGDFNGNGKSDLIWRQASTGATVMWLMNGSTIVSAAYLGGSADWAVDAATGTVTIAVSPKRAALTTSQTQQFTASLVGASSPAATWYVDGTVGGSATLGTVSSSGVYTPPSTAGTHTVTAISQSDPTQTASASIAVTDLAGVFTYHNDVARTGQNLQEYALNTTNVADPTAFGKLFSCPVDAAVYAQPLYVANLAIGGGTHNVVFIVTENDSVYAFDADGATDSNGNCLAYWYRSFLSTDVTAVPSSDTAGGVDQPGTLGITGTPVIGGSTIYMVARFKTTAGQYSEEFRALNIATGADIANSPVTISATVPGTAQGGTSDTFNSLTQSQRPALLLFHGVVYVAFGSAGDGDPYNGLLLAYDASTLDQTAVFNSTPNGGYSAEGAFWMCGSGPAADASYIYIASANGVFDNTANAVPPIAPSNDMGDSLLKFNSMLTMQDFFTPNEQYTDAGSDWDFGNGGVVVLPDSMGSASHPHLVLASSKDGNFWLVDRDAMGRYQTGAGGSDADVQTVSTGGYLFSTPAVWGNTLYDAPQSSALEAFPVSNAQIGSPSMHTGDAFTYGATPSISAQRTSNGIVWALDNSANGATHSTGWGPAILRAYDATNLGKRLYSSDALPADACGDAVKFTVPTIANGKVYVGGAAGTAAGQAGQLTVYGLKP